MSRSRRRSRLVVLVVLVIAAVALWCGYWYASDRIVASAVARTAASLAAGGREVNCTTNTVGGFPLSLDLDCGEVRYNDRNQGVTVALSRVTATAPLYWPGSVDAVVAGPLTVEAPDLGISLAASWTNATANVDAGFGGLNGGSLTLDQIEVTPGDGKLRLPVTHVTAARASASAGPASGNAYRFLVAADDVAVKPKKGKELPPFAASVDVSLLDFGGSLGTDPGRTLRTWLAAGGRTMQIADATITSGGASARTSGTITVSGDGLVSGQLMVRLAGLDQIPAIAEKIKPGSEAKVSQAVAMIVALGKPAADDPNAREVPLVIRNGEVTVSVFKVATIPPMEF